MCVGPKFPKSQGPGEVFKEKSVQAYKNLVLKENEITVQPSKPRRVSL